MSTPETPQVSGLVEQLKEAIDADERTALEAAGPKGIWPAWETSEFFGYETPHVLIGLGSKRQPLSGGHFTHRPVEKRFADHIIRHDPARTLAMVAAHREILELHQVDYIAPAFNVYGLRVRDGWICSVCSERVDGEPQRCDGPACPTVILLARGYGIEVQ